MLLEYIKDKKLGFLNSDKETFVKFNSALSITTNTYLKIGSVTKFEKSQLISFISPFFFKKKLYSL